LALNGVQTAKLIRDISTETSKAEKASRLLLEVAEEESTVLLALGNAL